MGSSMINRRRFLSALTALTAAAGLPLTEFARAQSPTAGQRPDGAAPLKIDVS